MAVNPFTTFSAPKTFSGDGVPEDFSEDIRRYSRIRGKPADYMPSGIARPDYQSLLGPRLDYYLWWRDCADRGKLLSPDSGYAWLRCTELINMGGDPNGVLEAIIRFTRACASSLRLAPMVCGLAEDYALAKGLPLDAVPRGQPFADSKVLTTWDITRYPMRRPAPGMLLDPALHNWRRDVELPDDRMEDILFLSLTGIDEHTRSAQGVSAVESCDPVKGIATIHPFSGFVDYSGTGVVRMPVVSLSEGGLRDLLDGIVRQAARLVRTDGKASPSVPKSFPKEYRRIVAAAVDAVVRGDAWDARLFRSPVADGEGFWASDDIEAVPEDEERPSVIPIPYPEFDPPTISQRILDSNWDEESEDEVPYVSSRRLRICHPDMDADQRAFYISWRTRARRGVYGDTDAGYLWLYCTELVNHDYEPRRVQDELERAVEAYYDAFPAPIPLCRAVQEHAILHGFDVPSTPLDECDAGILCDKLERDPVGAITPGVALYLAPGMSDTYVRGDHHVYTEALTAAVSAADGVLRDQDGVRFIDLIRRDSPFPMNRYLYSDLWQPGSVSIKVRMYSVRSSKTASDLLDGTVRAAVHGICRHLGKAGPNIPRSLPAAYARAVADAVDAAFDDMRERERRREFIRKASEVRFDSDAVRAAAADLDAVTGMMTVEGDRITESTPPSVEEAVEGRGGMAALVAVLDDVERRYLRACMDGSGASVLKGTGRRAGAVEQSINDKAMDAFGDAVMEDGRIYDDYADDLRRLLRWRRSPRGPSRS